MAIILWEEQQKNNRKNWRRIKWVNGWIEKIRE